jgi:PKD repeat protein
MYVIYGAQTYSFSYRFASGDLVSGSFAGTPSGNLITGLTNISVFINGTPFRGNGHVFNLGWVYNQQLPGNPGSAVASFDGTGNAFSFYDYDPSGPYDPNGKEFSSNPYFGGQTTYAYLRNAESFVWEGTGCSCSTAAYVPANWTVTPAGSTAPPVANFTWSPSVPKAGGSVQFTDMSTGSPASRSWSFGDGGSSSATNPQHNYSTAGTYTVSLTANNSAGSDSVSKQVVVTALQVTINSFTAIPSTIDLGGSLTLSWSTTNASSVLIDHGVGDQPTSGSVSVRPTATTTYTVTATGADGVRVTASVNVTVRTPCPVPTFSAPPLPDWEQNGPPQSSLTSDVDRTLDHAMTLLTETLKANDDLSYSRSSGYRPIEYQRHLRDLRDTYDQLVTQKRSSSTTANLVEFQCATLIAMLNHEIDDVHRIVRHASAESVDSLGGRGGAPAVSLPAQSNHTLLPAMAVDLTIPANATPLQLATIDRRAASAGVIRPCAVTDRVHFQVAGTRCNAQVTIQVLGHSPIALLLTTSDGRRIGFDPSSGSVVNDFGDAGYFSGVGSEPQEVLLKTSADETFKVSGIGTAFGTYQLDLFVFPADSDGSDPAQAIARKSVSGTTTPGETLAVMTVTPPSDTGPARRRAVQH